MTRLEYMKLATDPSPGAIEVRVPLVVPWHALAMRPAREGCDEVKPEAEQLQLLRCELQKWMYKFRSSGISSRGLACSRSLCGHAPG